MLRRLDKFRGLAFISYQDICDNVVHWLSLKSYQKSGFWGLRGLKVNSNFSNPKKAHPWAKPRLMSYRASKSVQRSDL